MKVIVVRLLLAWLVTGGPLTVVDASADDTDQRIEKVLQEFRKSWTDDRVPYRNDQDRDSWKVYGRTLQRLIALGPAAVKPLMAACESPHFQVRSVAARALGWLQAAEAVPVLVGLLDDSQPAVAVLAADALGQIRGEPALRGLKAAQRTVRNGDVLLHISKALERDVPLESDLVEQLNKLNDSTVGSAMVGKSAPPFELRDADGKRWSLADRRGKRAVVLVFIYGDG